MKSGSVICTLLIMVLLYLSGTYWYLYNSRTQFDEVASLLQRGQTVVINDLPDKDSLTQFLINRGYYDEEKDAELIASHLIDRIGKNQPVEFLGQLNSAQYKLSADTILQYGGKQLRARLSSDSRQLGQDVDFDKATEIFHSQWDELEESDAKITVNITNDKAHRDAQIEGILVRLQKHSYDTIIAHGDNTGTNYSVQPVSSILGYARTDQEGKVVFNVKRGQHYSVLPIKRGFQYGRSKGTSMSAMPASLNLSFKQTEQSITPFSQYVYQNIKSNQTIIVRTPDEFRHDFITSSLIFIFSWIFFFVVQMFRDRIMKVKSDYVVPFCLMFLTGVSVLTAYSINNPLIDKNYGSIMANAVMIGIIAMILISSLNFNKLYVGLSRLQFGVIPFDPIHKYVELRRPTSLTKQNGFKILRGITYLLLAVLLIFMLALFGSGPEGSVAHVNLFGFQPSELCKYLILIFIAAFMADNAMLLQQFSQRITTLTIRRHLTIIASISLILIIISLLYLKVLSDMGPALVIIVTFICLYAMARRDFPQLLIGCCTFVVTLLLFNYFNLSLWIATLLWFASWAVIGWVKFQRIYESAIFLNLLIVVFLLGPDLLTLMGAESEASRLTSRMGMVASGAWNNTVPGGDQIAQGLWSLASGGLWGMGPGCGNPNTVPAAHTDMIFTSIGEIYGWIGLMAVLIVVFILVRRTLIIGRNSAQPFVLYLTLGIGIITAVQTLLIICGSIGLLPLTGVSLPLLSYGRTSLIITLSAFGIVISASRAKPTEAQLKYAETFTPAIAASVLSIILCIGVVIFYISDFQLIHRDDTIIRPAYIATSDGARIVEYNPRIAITLDKMNSGSIYDRNGLLLATSSRDELLDNIDNLVTTAGLDRKELLKLANKSIKRYYPFGNNTLFMLGDANNKIVYYSDESNPIGYLAESRHRDSLRGFKFPLNSVTLASDTYKPTRFMPPAQSEFTGYEYDYSILLPYLKYDSNHNPLIEKYNEDRPQRDLYMTIDAALQTKMQKRLREYLSSKTDMPDLRASVVVVDAQKGDLLASANYPLPDQDTIAMLSNLHIYGDSPAESMDSHAPITERDLGTSFFTAPGSTAKVLSAMAGLKKYGTAAARADSARLVLNREKIHTYNHGNNITMHDAIVYSSNNFFINTVNSGRLYDELDYLYSTFGLRVSLPFSPQNANSYFYNQTEANDMERFHDIMKETAKQSYRVFDKIYMPEREDKRHKRNSYHWNLNETGMAWGQGGLAATPLSMARAVATVANGGNFVPTRYVLTDDDINTIQVISTDQANTLSSFMIDEFMNKPKFSQYLDSSVYTFGGKTGTPERGKRNSAKTVNDAWYVFFIKRKDGRSNIAVAVRLERTVGHNSSFAVDAVKDVILPQLKESGYLN